MSSQAGFSSAVARRRVDRLGLLVVAVALAGLVLPFATLRPNRIVPGQGITLVEALPFPWAAALVAALGIALLVALFVRARPLRLMGGLFAMSALAVTIGIAANALTPAGDTFARVSPASGFWLLLAAMALLVMDSLTRLKLPPLARIALLAGALVAISAVLTSGLWADLSVMREYASRAAVFWKEGRTHLLLAFGSVAAAVAVGIPIGILCHRQDRLRGPILNLLNIVQTIPSIALFGLLIAPLAWVAANVPGARAAGIAGIGMAPALVALFAYALLPVVSNTVAGLAAVPGAAVDAARGMGMTPAQRLLSIELPLAVPVILTGIRIVLVQNIGLATIAALIGGGGFGVFVFQGIGQTAMDLVLLGAIPTITIAFATAVVFDAGIDASSRGASR